MQGEERALLEQELRRRFDANDLHAVAGLTLERYGPELFGFLLAIMREEDDAADVFSDVLNDPNSRLQQRLVDSGLWDGVVVNYYTLDNTGPITISGQTSPQRLRQALVALYAEIPKFATSAYFDPEEIAATKALRAVSSAFDRERSSGFAHTLGFWWSVASLEYYMGYVDNMAAQTLADLTGYASKYIVGKPRITGVLIDPTSRRSLNLTTAELIGGGR